MKIHNVEGAVRLLIFCLTHRYRSHNPYRLTIWKEALQTLRENILCELGNDAVLDYHSEEPNQREHQIMLKQGKSLTQAALAG